MRILDDSSSLLFSAGMAQVVSFFSNIFCPLQQWLHIVLNRRYKSCIATYKDHPTGNERGKKPFPSFVFNKYLGYICRCALLMYILHFNDAKTIG